MFTGQNFWIRVSFVHHVEHGRETMWEKNTKKDANRILGTTNTQILVLYYQFLENSSEEQ